MPYSNSVKIISLNRDKLLARLRSIVSRLKRQHPEVSEVRAFGSLARGDHTGTSDVDVLIVLHHAQDRDPHRRALTYLPYFDLDRGTDLLIFTRAELERRLATHDRQIMKLWDESIRL